MGEAMTDLPQRMVEAAARAMWRHRWRAYMEAIGDLEWADRAWLLQPMDTHQRYEGFARASLRAALALADGENVALLPTGNDIGGVGIDKETRAYIRGSNDRRAATLAGRVEV